MPGAFAHITAAQCASENTALARLTMPSEAKRIISQNIKFIELGCVSPDYPYLAVTSPSQAQWADCMHYERTGEMLKALITKVKERPSGAEKQKAFAWLCGYIGHVIADITIHPVVERRVGPYEQNKRAHRVCEMNQDAFIWETKLKLGGVGYADRVRENIGTCGDPDDDSKLNSVVGQVWTESLLQTYPECVSQSVPKTSDWHNAFQAVVDSADEGHRLFALARHVAVDQGLTYPTLEEVEHSYIYNLDTPRGLMNYEEVFDRAVANIRSYWEIAAQAVFEGGPVDAFLNWNLDTGETPDGCLTAWDAS